MLLPNVQLPDVLHEQDGEVRVKGHRISLYHVVSAYNDHGITPEGMVFYYPTLSYDEIKKVFEFYYANQAEVDEYARAYKAELRRQEAIYSGKGPTREELLRRREEKRNRESQPGPQAEAG